MVDKLDMFSDNEYSNKNNYLVPTAPDLVDANTFDRNLQNIIPPVSQISEFELSSCKEVQIGTKIITSNFTVVGQDQLSLDILKGTVNGNKVTKDTSNNNNLFLPKKFESNFRKFVYLGFVLVLFLFVVILIVINLMIVKGYEPSGESTITFSSVTTNSAGSSSGKYESTFDYTPTVQNVTSSSSTSNILSTTKIPEHTVSWFVTKKEWGAYNTTPCKHDIHQYNIIKIIRNGYKCYDFKTCSYCLKYQQNMNIEHNYKDLIFHFGVSTDSTVYEGRNPFCQTVPIYRECNKTMLLVQLYSGYCHYNETLAEKQIVGLEKLIEYGKNNSFIDNKTETIFYLFKTCSFDFLTRKLNKSFEIEFYDKNEYVC